jgi:hypothetical protein
VIEELDNDEGGILEGIIEEEGYKKGTIGTKDLRRVNGRRKIQEWDNGERGILEGLREEEGYKNGTIENEGS